MMKRLIPIGIVAMVVLLVALVALVPYEAQLGNRLKLVLFHGASTWVNLVTITVTGIAAAAYLVTRRPRAYEWAAAFFRVSLPMWIFNTVLGLISAYLAWSKIHWSEPKLRMTFALLIALGVVLAVRLMAENPMWPAAADVLLAGALWPVILAVREVAHPNSPVFASAWRIQALFFGQVGAIAVLVTLLAMLMRPALETGEDASGQDEAAAA